MLFRTIVPVFFTCVGAATAFALYMGTQERNALQKSEQRQVLYAHTSQTKQEQSAFKEDDIKTAAITVEASDSIPPKATTLETQPETSEQSLETEKNLKIQDNSLASQVRASQARAKPQEVKSFIQAQVQSLEKSSQTPPPQAQSQNIEKKTPAETTSAKEKQAPKGTSEKQKAKQKVSVKRPRYHVPKPEFAVINNSKTLYKKENAVTSDERKAFDATMDGHLEKLLAFKLSEADQKHVKDALKLYKQRKYSQAWALAEKASDPTAQKLIKWYRYKDEPDFFKLSQLQKFWLQNPDWPELDKLRAAAENIILLSSTETKQDYFKEEEPITTNGLIAQANMLKASGRGKEALGIIRKIWHTKNLSRDAEKTILRKYKKDLTAKDHRKRVDTFLYRGRTSFVPAALRATKHLSAAERKKIDVRVAGLRKQRKVGGMIDRLSKKDKLDMGVLFARIQFARRRDRDQQAWDFFKLVKHDDADLIGSPDAWWKERRLHVRNALEQKKYKTAYRLAKNHGPLSVNPLNEARFLSGWIALRYLKKPKVAYQHFTDLKSSADGPRSTSRAKYWLGRAALAMKQDQKAQTYFSSGARFFNTFYGQLSQQSLNPKQHQIYLPLPPAPTQEDVDVFYKRDAVRAVLIAHQLGDETLRKRLLHHLRFRITEPGELMLLAHLAKKIQANQDVVRIGKLAMFRGINAAHYAYPVHAIPDFKPLRSMPEPAFYYAIARQESEFNATIISPAGARGLLQIMPSTARYIAKQHKVKYQKAKLLNSPSYNAKLGTAYIGDRLDDFNGSYIKTIAGYNAGQGRVRQWVRKFGNPASSNIDPIDWIERIPFTETRNYVKKVLSNIQVYRSRLGKAEQALYLRRDIYRSRRDKKSATRPLLATN